MSESKQTVENQSEDGFSVIEQSVKKYFIDIEHSVPRFQQELFDLQNEYYKAWKGMMNEGILLQKEFLNKAGFYLPEAVQKIIENMSEDLVKARLVRDNISITTIVTMKKNMRMWNDNAIMFFDLNKKIMRFLISGYTLKQENKE